MNVEQRKSIEKQVAERLVTGLLAVGYYIRVHDGEEWVTLQHTHSKSEIMKSLFSTDEDEINVYRLDYPTRLYVFIGSVSLVYGNDGWDVITDYSTSLEHILGPVCEFAETLDPRG